MKKKTTTKQISITFRPTKDILRKLEAYMKATGEENKSAAIKKAIECGIDTLEAVGWDASRDAAARRVTKMLELLPDNPGKLSKPA